MLIDCSTTAQAASPPFFNICSPLYPVPRINPPVHLTSTEKTSRRKSFTRKCEFAMNAKVYTLAELQLATSSFCEENLLGEGSLGSVYKAEFPDGQVILYLPKGFSIMFKVTIIVLTEILLLKFLSRFLQ